MKKITPAEIQVGASYLAKIKRKWTLVKVTGVNRNGWEVETYDDPPVRAEIMFVKDFDYVARIDTTTK